MRQFKDETLGMITVRDNHLSRSIRMRLSPRGEIVVTAPPRTPLFIIKQAIKKSHASLVDMQNTTPRDIYHDGQQIGHSHQLAIVSSTLHDEVSITVSKRTIIVSLPSEVRVDDDDVQLGIRDHVVQILRKEAKAYLPKRLATLAERHGFSYASVRFPHAISRWGSCSSTGTISLNIALMRLDLDLIDYVILHELTHTRHMNHSRDFWSTLETTDPHYRLHRRQIKTHTPIV